MSAQCGVPAICYSKILLVRCLLYSVLYSLFFSYCRSCHLSVDSCWQLTFYLFPFESSSTCEATGRRPSGGRLAVQPRQINFWSVEVGGLRFQQQCFFGVNSQNQLTRAYLSRICHCLCCQKVGQDISITLSTFCIEGSGSVRLAFWNCIFEGSSKQVNMCKMDR